MSVLSCFTLYVNVFTVKKMEGDTRTDDYPQEIDEQLTGFNSSVSAVQTMLEKLMAMPRSELLQKVIHAFMLFI